MSSSTATISQASEVSDLSKTVNGAAGRIEEGKRAYEDALGRGDERAMKNALAKICQANEDRDAATFQGPVLADRIEALRNRQSDMTAAIGPMREAAGELAVPVVIQGVG